MPAVQGAPHLAPALGAQRPRPARISLALPLALEADAVSIAPLRKRTKANLLLLLENLGEIKAVREASPRQGFLSLGGAARGAPSPQPQAPCLPCICLPRPSLGPWTHCGPPWRGLLGVLTAAPHLRAGSAPVRREEEEKRSLRR